MPSRGAIGSGRSTAWPEAAGGCLRARAGCLYSGPMNRSQGDEERRIFLVGAVGAGLALAVGPARAADAPKKGAGKKEADIPPTEDLMREHGVLRRILLIYE